MKIYMNRGVIFLQGLWELLKGIGIRSGSWDGLEEAISLVRCQTKAIRYPPLSGTKLLSDRAGHGF